MGGKPKKQQKKEPKKASIARSHGSSGSRSKRAAAGARSRVVNKQRHRSKGSEIEEPQSKKDRNSFRFTPQLQQVLSRVRTDMLRTSTSAVSSQLPSGGSRFVHNLLQLRELCLAPAFVHLERSLSHQLGLPADASTLSSSFSSLLPSILLQQHQIVEQLLHVIRAGSDARHSQCAAAQLASALCEDVRDDFLAPAPPPHASEGSHVTTEQEYCYFARLVDAFAYSLDSGKLSVDAEVVDAYLAAFSHCLSVLHRQLTANLPLALQLTQPLRHVGLEHIRAFANEALAYIFRSCANGAQLHAGVLHLLQECRDGKLQRNATATVLAHAAKGAAGSLHSRCTSRVLGVLFDPAAAFVREDSSMSTDLENPQPSCRKDDPSQSSTNAPEDAAYLTAKEAIDILAEDVRGERAELLWACLLAPVKRHVQKVRESSWNSARRYFLAQGVDLIAYAVAERNGVLVHSFPPLLELAEELSQLLENSVKNVEVHTPAEAAQELVSSALTLIRCIAHALAKTSTNCGAATELVTAAQKASWSGIFRAAPAQSLVKLVHVLVQLDASVLSAFADKLLPQLTNAMQDKCANQDERAQCMYATACMYEALPLAETPQQYLAQCMFLASSLLAQWQRDDDDSGSGKQNVECSDYEAFASFRLFSASSSHLLWATDADLQVSQDGQLGHLDLSSTAHQTVAHRSLATCSSACDRITRKLQVSQNHSFTVGSNFIVEAALLEGRKSEALLATAIHQKYGNARYSRDHLAHKAVEACIFSMSNQGGLEHAGVSGSSKSANTASCTMWLLLAAAQSINTEPRIQTFLFSKEYLQQSILPAFEPHLQSSSSTVRQAALTIIATADAGHLHRLDETDDEEEEERCTVFASVLEASRVPAQDVLAHSRRATNLMTAVQRVCASRRVPYHYIRSLALALLGELRQRFALLYPAIVNAASVLFQRYNESEVNKLLFAQIEATQHTLSAAVSGCDCSSFKSTASSFDRDIAREDSELGDAVLKCASIADADEPDPSTQLAQLLNILHNAGSFAEDNIRQLVSLFLAYNWEAQPTQEQGLDEHGDYTEENVITNEEDRHSNLRDENYDALNGKRLYATKKTAASQRNVMDKHQSGWRRAWRSGLHAWLKLLCELNGGKQLKGDEAIGKPLYLQLLYLLQSQDWKTQQLAIDCLSKWKLSFLNPYVSEVKRLAQPNEVREVMTCFKLSKDVEDGQPSIKQEHRADLIPLITRMLLPRIMVHSHGKGAERRAVSSAAVLTYLAQLETEELRTLVDRLMEPMQSCFKRNVNSSHMTSNALREVNFKQAELVPRKKKVGFLRTANEALKCMGTTIMPYIHFFLALAITFLEQTVRDANGVVQKAEKGQQTIRRLCHSFLVGCFRSFPELDYNIALQRLFSNVIEPLSSNLLQDASSGAVPTVLGLLEALCETPFFLRAVSESWHVVNAVIDVIGCNDASERAKETAMFICETLYESQLFNRRSVPHFLEQIRSSIEIKQRNSFKPECETELGILESIGRSAAQDDAALACRCVWAVLPLVQHRKNRRSFVRHISENQAPTMCRALDAAISLLPSALKDFQQGESMLHELSNTMQSLVSSGGPRSIRQRIIELLRCCNEHSSKRFVADDAVSLLAQLNAYDTCRATEEYDFDSRVSAYAQCTDNLFQQLDMLSASFLMLQALLDLHCPDIALRQAATRALSNFFCACKGGALQQHVQLVRNTLYPRARHALTSPHEYVRSQHLHLMREASMTLDEYFPELQPLKSDDVEQDFFCNVSHIQAYRRAKALRLLKQLSQHKVLSKMVLLEIGEPMVHVCLTDSATDVAETANQCLGTIAQCLSPGAYKQVVRKYTRLLAKCNQEGSGSSKLTGKLLCRSLAQLVENMPNEMQRSDLDDLLHHQNENQDKETMDGTSALQKDSKDLVDFLKREVLPVLSEQIIVSAPSDKREQTTIRPQALLAAVKVIKWLPQGAAGGELHRHLGRAAEKLRSRLQGTRDAARSALVLAAGELGQSHLPSLVSLLQSVLRQGFQSHVLGYTVHAMLERVVQNIWSGQLEQTVCEVVAPIFSEDIFGVVAEEKEVDAIANKAKETKKCKGYDAFELLAQNVALPQSLQQLMEPLQTHICTTVSHARRTKLDSLLQSISRGMLKNTSFEANDLLLFCFRTADDALKAEENISTDGVLDTSKGQQLFASQTNPHFHSPRDERASKLRDAAGMPTDLSRLMQSFQDKDEDEERLAPHHHHQQGALYGDHGLDGMPNADILLSFATHLLRAHLKKHLAVDESKVATGIENAGGLDRLAGLIPLLLRILGSTVCTDALDHVLRCFTHLIPLGLETVEQQSESICEQIVAILQKEPRLTSSTAQEGCKTLATLLKHCETKKELLSQDRTRFIISSVFADLENPETKNSTYTLLRAILARKPMLPEVYDLMERVASIMVRSQDDAIREHSSKALVQFLIEYPLAEKRLRRHLESLVANLEFEHPTGRIAALNCFLRVVHRFPYQTLTSHAAYLFFPLVTRLTSDDDHSCRLLASEVLSCLLSSIETNERDRLVSYPVKWLSNSRSKLRHAGVQTLTVVVRVCPKALRSEAQKIVSALEITLNEASLHIRDDEYMHEFDSGSWQPLYSSLQLLKHLCESSLHQVARKAELWRNVLSLAEYPHAWVQKKCAELLNTYACEWCNSKLETSYCDFLTRDNHEVFLLARAMCKQLSSNAGVVDTEHSQSVERCLRAVASGCALRQPKPSIDQRSTPKRTLKWLAKRVGTIMTSGATEQARLTAVRWAGSAASSLAQAHQQCQASKSDQVNGEEIGMLTALEGVCVALLKCTDRNTKNVHESVRLAAIESLEYIKSYVGAAEYAQVMKKARNAVHGKREQKRNARLIEAVTDPVESAQRKRLKRTHSNRVGSADDGGTTKQRRVLLDTSTN